MCLPLRRASVFLRQRAREWTVTGLRMIRPSFTSLRICWPEGSQKTSKLQGHSDSWSSKYTLNTNNYERQCARPYGTTSLDAACRLLYILWDFFLNSLNYYDAVRPLIKELYSQTKTEMQEKQTEEMTDVK